MPTPSQIDPTRTITLRNQFRKALRVRFNRISREIRQAVVDADVFGLKDPSSPFTLAANLAYREFSFDTDPDKVRKFRSWLRKMMNDEILEVDSVPPWTNEYIDSSYRKGLVRAYTDTRRLEAVEGGRAFSGALQEFLTQSFSAPETASKLELLYTRTYNGLEGITNHMDAQISRILTQGLLEGRNPRAIAKTMTDEVSKISRTRAEVLARTEIIHAHAEGQLDSFNRLGIQEVGAIVEWSTAGDDRVCQRCAELNGKTYTIEQARGKIPLHPNCRCTWIPSVPSK